MAAADPRLLEKLARLAIQVGVNVQAGQRLLLTAPVELAPFVRLLTRHAYQAGARFVETAWEDGRQNRLRLELAPQASLGEYPDWRAQLRIEYFSAGDALLSVSGEDPDVMAGVDPAALEVAARARSQKMAPALELLAKNTSNWSVVAGATPAWAQKVFPDLPAAEAEGALWNAIFDVCRVRAADPVAAWREHVAALHRRRDYLDAKAYAALQMRGPGTDLTMGLPAGHRWTSGGVTAANGVFAVPNIPTEEVFSMPHREQIDGFVSSTKPLSLRGTIIEDFTLTFANGRVQRAAAAKGQAVLDALLEMDEGARSLGEVALVPHSSPVSQSGIVFYNTLFDENASCHLALGSALRLSLDGGSAMDADAFQQAGGNRSQIHEDFMVGSAALDIDGLWADGTVEAVMRQGEWAFDI